MNYDGWMIYDEPVFEWQWMYPKEGEINTFIATPSHFTTEESERDNNIERGLILFDSSKRIKKKQNIKKLI